MNPTILESLAKNEIIYVIMKNSDGHTASSLDPILANKEQNG